MISLLKCNRKVIIVLKPFKQKNVLHECGVVVINCAGGIFIWIGSAQPNISNITLEGMELSVVLKIVIFNTETYE